MIVCTRCKMSKPADEFYRDASKKNGLTGQCKMCKRAAIEAYRVKDRDGYYATMYAYRARNPEKARAWARRAKLKRQFGLTPEQYDAMVVAQGGVCGICKDRNPGGKGEGSWCIDHDHSCCPGINSCGKCVRALLCHNCNTTLGRVGDDPEILQAMIAYLDKYATLRRLEEGSFEV